MLVLSVEEFRYMHNLIGVGEMMGQTTSPSISVIAFCIKSATLVFPTSCCILGTQCFLATYPSKPSEKA
jgi:hypothetical protein